MPGPRPIVGPVLIFPLPLPVSASLFPRFLERTTLDLRQTARPVSVFQPPLPISDLPPAPQLLLSNFSPHHHSLSSFPPLLPSVASSTPFPPLSSSSSRLRRDSVASRALSADIWFLV